MERPVLLITGLLREARAIGGGVFSIVSGANCAILRSRLAIIDPSAFSGVLSFGLAGGLDPALQAGDLVLGNRVIAAGAADDVDPVWAHSIGAVLAARGIAVIEGAIAGVEAALLNPADKSVLRTKTRAVACDMESHIAGDFAAQARLPFAILRAISDPAERALPTLAATAVQSDGTVALGRVIMGLARKPREIGALLEAGRDSRAAFRTLEHCKGLFVAG